MAIGKQLEQSLTRGKVTSTDTGGKAARKTLATVGSLTAALAASSCCVIPLVLFLLGISGAWISTLTALAPYQPLFVVLTLGFLGWGFVLVYRKPQVVCAEGSYCARPVSDRIAKAGLWIATMLIAIALAFPYLAPLAIDT